MNLNTVRRKAAALGLDTRVVCLTGGGDGLYILLERVIDGETRPIDRVTEGELFRYLTRYKIAYEYRGYYTSLLIRL